MFVYGSRRSFEWGFRDGDDPIVTLLHDPEGLQAMGKAMRALSVPDALDRIVDAVLEYAKN